MSNAVTFLGRRDAGRYGGLYPPEGVVIFRSAVDFICPHFHWA